MTPSLKTMNFPAGKNRILRYVGQSTSRETGYVLPLIQRAEDRRYDNVSEIAEAAKVVS